MAQNYPPYETGSVPVLETNIWSIVSLVAGVLGWLGIFGLGGIVAVVAGHVAKNQIRANAGRMAGDGLATAGLILGYLNIAFTLVGLCVLLLLVLGVLSFLPISHQIQIH